MTATNHALTGAAIGLTVSNPFIAVPVAFLSHFVLDALPHYGKEDVDLKSRAFKLYLIAEALICFTIVVWLATLQPAHWQLAAVCAFIATSPDFMSIRGFLVAQSTGERAKPRYWFTKFAKWIQWCERPWGWIVELGWLVAMVSVLAALS